MVTTANGRRKKESTARAPSAPTSRRGSKAKLERQTFTTSRLLDFLSKKELVAQIGHGTSGWPLVLVKELLDNALDACEEADTPPKISVNVNGNVIAVTDNGPGIPPETIDGILDFAVRVSSREAYVSPTRGAQGNALKTIVAMPFVLDGQSGRVDVLARGIRHEITLRVDRIRQQPVIDHQQHPDKSARSGTTVQVHWPDSPRGQEAEEEEDASDLEENDFASNDSPRSILAGARERFLQIADDYTFLNPHLTLSMDWDPDRSQVTATDPAWKKWKPSDPPCPHWYQPEHLERQLAAYIANDADHGRDRTVREFIADFAGLSSTAKQKAVLAATGFNRKNLSALTNGDGMDSEAVGRLLMAMQETKPKPVKPLALGVIGKEHLQARFTAVGCEMESFKYVRDKGVTNGLPWIIETAFAWCPEAQQRRIITGVNWSAAIINPFRELGTYGDSLDSILAKQRADRDKPVVFVLHLALPRPQYADRGKSSVVIER
jgi:DNA topoisomerase VI subunit B